MILNTTQERILLVLHRLHELTNAQIQRYLDLRTYNHVQTLTMGLRDAGYIFERKPIKDGRRGTLPSLFLLDQAGRDHLLSVGMMPKKRFRKTEQGNYPSPLHLRHLMAVNDFLIGCELFQRYYEGVRIIRYLHDYDTRQWVSDVKPDAWVNLQIGEGMQDRAYLIEVDRGTESNIVIREKVAALCRLIDDHERYQRLFGTNRMTGVLFIATGNPHHIPPVPAEERLVELSDLVQQVLTARELLPEWNDVFRYATVTQASDPEWLATHL